MKLGKRPAQGDKRTVIRFAWIPTVMTNRNVIWLEKYKDHQEYSSGYDLYWITITTEEISSEDETRYSAQM